MYPCPQMYDKRLWKWGRNGFMVVVGWVWWEQAGHVLVGRVTGYLVECFQKVSEKKWTRRSGYPLSHWVKKTRSMLMGNDHDTIFVWFHIMYHNKIGLLVDSEVVLSLWLDTVSPGDLSTRPYQQRPLINKTLSKETSYQQGLIVGKLG
jgi:hypothetical protein